MKRIFLPLWLHILLIFISGLLTSCANHISKPPSSWDVSDKSISEKTCSDISGVYQNRGIEAPDNNSGIDRTKYPKYLSEYFAILRVNGFEHRWITHLKLTPMYQGKFKVVFKQKDKTIATKTMIKMKDFTCTPQGIRMSTSGTSATVYGPEYRSNEKFYYKATDGSLIVKDSHSEAGVFAVIPYGGTTTEFYKFPPFMEKTP